MVLMDFATFLSFVFTCLVIELTPGPNMAYLALLSAREGRRAGFAAVGGVALGLFIVGVLSAFGLAAFISSSVLAYEILRFAGIGYMLWLAWDGWTQKMDQSVHQIPSYARDVKFFKRGLIVNILNPKAVFFYIAILPQFISPALSSMTQAILLAVVFVFVATSIHIMIVTLSGAARLFLLNDKRRVLVQRILSLSLVGIALWLLVSTAKGG